MSEPVEIERHPLTGEPISPKGETFWNGLPTEAIRGTAEVADSPEFPRYWAKTKGIVGHRIPVVRVVLDGVNYGGGVTYLDDRDGSGWRKVTAGYGSPSYGHRNVGVTPGSFAVSPDPQAGHEGGDPR